MLNRNLMLVHPAHVTSLRLNQPFLWQNSCHRLLWWKIEHFNSRSPFRRWTRARSAAFSGSLSWRRPDIEIYCLHPTFRGKGGGTLTLPCFPERGGRKRGGTGQTSPERGPFNCSRRAVFTPNQTFPPPPSRCQACFNKHGPNSLTAAAWQVVHEKLVPGNAAARSCLYFYFFFAGKCETRYNFQPSFACGDEREWVALTPRKDYFPRVNELIFHRYRLELPLLCCA